MSVISGNYQDTENFAGALKVFYAAKMIQTLNRDVVLRNRLKNMGKKKWTGLQHETSVNLGSSQAVGARPEGGYIPDAGNNTYAKAEIKSKYNYCTVSVTGVADARSGGKGAWAKVKAEAVQQSAEDLAFDLGRQCYGSPEGILAQVAGSPTGSGTTGSPYVVTILAEGSALLESDSSDASVSAKPAYAWRTTKNFRVNQNIVWGDLSTTSFSKTTGAVGLGYGYVSAVADDGTYTQISVVKTAGSALADGDLIVRGDDSAAGKHAYGNEMNGLTNIVDDGSKYASLHGISSADHAGWAAKVFQNPSSAGTKRPLTEQLLQHAIDKIKTRSNGKPDLAICHTSVRNAFVFHLKDQGRERFAPMKMQGGWSTLTYNAGDRPLDIVADRQARHHRLYLLDTRYIHNYEVLPFAWDQANGSTWKWVSGRDEMIAFGKTYGELGTTNRGAHGVIEDIAVSSFGHFE